MIKHFPSRKKGKKGSANFEFTPLSLGDRSTHNWLQSGRSVLADGPTSWPRQVARHPGAFFILLVVCLVAATSTERLGSKKQRCGGEF